MVDRKKLYGMDAELHFKMKAKEDPGTLDRRFAFFFSLLPACLRPPDLPCHRFGTSGG